MAKGRFYPEMPPRFSDETMAAYTDRLTGADGKNQRPYDHPRNRQCSIGWHEECSDPEGRECKCPCHSPKGEVHYRFKLSIEQAADLARIINELIADGEFGPEDKISMDELIAAHLPDAEREYVWVIDGQDPRFARSLTPAEADLLDPTIKDD